jgi:hypothetical protein
VEAELVALATAGATALVQQMVGDGCERAWTRIAAADRVRQARDLMRALPDPYNEARVLTSLGEAALAAGDLGAASGRLAEAAERMTREALGSPTAASLRPELAVMSRRG